MFSENLYIDNIESNCIINDVDTKIHLSKITRNDYMMFDRSLNYFIFNQFVFFANFKIIKLFLFNIFNNIIEDNTVISFLIYIFQLDKFQVCMKNIKVNENTVVKFNNIILVNYLMDFIKKNLNNNDNNRIFFIKLVLKINNNSFNIYIGTEDDFEIIVDPRYYNYQTEN